MRYTRVILLAGLLEIVIVYAMVIACDNNTDKRSGTMADHKVCREFWDIRDSGMLETRRKELATLSRKADNPTLRKIGKDIGTVVHHRDAEWISTNTYKFAGECERIGFIR